MWNDTDQPLALLITFRTYGTWLHGDPRGSVDRHNNAYGTPRIPRNDTWCRLEAQSLKRKTVYLHAARRKAVAVAIRETCEKRGWSLLAVNVRTNHAHSVIDPIGKDPDRVLIALKSNATRRMRETGCWREAETPWAEKGSKRNLWNDASVEMAIYYVRHAQGDELPKFDD
jgi:REP element-mobilizing transposase RayT